MTWIFTVVLGFRRDQTERAVAAGTGVMVSVDGRRGYARGGGGVGVVIMVVLMLVVIVSDELVETRRRCRGDR